MPLCGEATSTDIPISKGELPPLLGPLEHLAYYSDDGEVRYDLSCLRAFKEPKIPADLLQGRGDCIKRNRKNRILGHPRPLDEILASCLARGTASAIREADVVTWRGILTKYLSRECMSR